MTNNAIPLSLYIHMPWCIKKCLYCDFNSHQVNTTMPETQYINTLIADLQQSLSLIQHRPLHSIFIGGGTPSLFKAESYQTLFNVLKDNLSFSANMEITMEANPGTFEQERFKAYRDIGINRLSLGVQSFDNDLLKKLGRIHSGDDAQNAIEKAITIGFEQLNIDIMHSLPKQSLEQALNDLHIALSFKPTHLSWYQLTIEPNTYFYSHRPTLPSEETAKALEQQSKAVLSAYHHYEISAYCLDNNKSNHNMNYWLFGDYLGIGAGAHSKLADDGQVTRMQKRRQPTDYINNNTPIKKTTLSTKDLIFEFMLNVTRLKQKIAKSMFQQRTYLPYHELSTTMQKAKKLDLMDEDDEYFWVTPFGHRYLNDLQSLFL